MSSAGRLEGSLERLEDGLGLAPDVFAGLEVQGEAVLAAQHAQVDGVETAPPSGVGVLPDGGVMALVGRRLDTDLPVVPMPGRERSRLIAAGRDRRWTGRGGTVDAQA